MDDINRTAHPLRTRDEATGLEWWRGKVMYQIYPRSFMDSNGDGVGDLNGITSRLDYVADLGVEGIWISPFFTSPMKDFGYDVSDYRDVDPVFGTLQDFDRLVARAHDLGLKVIIDQVYSHTSDQHPWFAESRQDATNPKADWYVWQDPKPDGTPPNNWLSAFGGPAWTWDGRRRKYYLHNFLASQPDLNLHNPKVQDALLDVMRFWLERGVDGLRLDAINLGMHDPQLRDNPPMPDDGGPIIKPYFMQQHKWNLSHDDMPVFLARLRSAANAYGAVFTVAEIGGVDVRPVQMAYTSEDRHLSAAYSFEFLSPVMPTAEQIAESLDPWPDDPTEGWPAWAFSNHDAERIANRWNGGQVDPDWARLMGLLLLSLRGNIFLYQGEELGLPQAQVPFERLQDPEALANWPHTLGRDGARTPMPWVSDHPLGGFSSAEPWLPMDPHHLPLAVAAQEDDPGSLLHWTRRLVRLRHASPALLTGTLRFLKAPEGVLAFVREHEEECVAGVFNLGEAPVAWTSPGYDFNEVLASVPVAPEAGTPASVPGRLAAASGYLARCAIADTPR